MKRFKTFAPKAGKQTRSREIPDSLKSSYRAPLTRNPEAHLNFKIQEISPKTQIHKLQRAMVHAAKHIKKLIERKGREPSNSAYLEREILKYEQLYSWRAVRMAILNQKQDIQDKRVASKKANEEKELSVLKAKTLRIPEKIDPLARLGTFNPIAKKEIEKVFGPKGIRKKKRFAKS